MDRDRSQSTEPPPAKRQRTLACRRCRHRRQKCSESRPCINCSRSGEECIPMEPIQRNQAERRYIQALEERVAHLEALDPLQSLDHHRVLLAHRRSIGNGHEEAEGSNIPSNTLNSEPSPAVSGSGSVAAVSAASVTSAAPSRPLAPRRSSILQDDDDDADVHQLLFTAVMSPTGCREDAVRGSFSSYRDDANASTRNRTESNTLFNLEAREELAETYFSMAQTQYPFLHRPSFLKWQAEWREQANGASSQSSDNQFRWKGFFVNLVYATALLLGPRAGLPSESRHYYKLGLSLLPYVFRQPDRVLHIQAYLLLTVYALHRPSTQRIIQLTSTATRYCVAAQLHLADAEPRSSNVNRHFEIQMRRRVFWCAYQLDRVVSATFDLPLSLPDHNISVKLFANVGDEDLVQVASATPASAELRGSTGFTGVSPALHITQVRRIQSEILGYTLHYDFSNQYAHQSDWRNRILHELQAWKSQVYRFTEPESKGYTSNRWLAMIYHYSLLMLYQPTKANVLGPAGDWSVQASSQACLIFRKSQMDREIAQPWLGLLFQFRSGITLLYCFWATPPRYRTPNFDSPDVSDALRACSNTFAVIADQWPRAECLRDVFELLVREIPVFNLPTHGSRRISASAVRQIEDKMHTVRCIVYNRSVLRMIEEMITDDFPSSTLESPQSARTDIGSSEHAESAMRQSSVAHMAFEMPFMTSMQDLDGLGMDLQEFSNSVPSFPGLF